MSPIMQVAFKSPSKYNHKSSQLVIELSSKNNVQTPLQFDEAHPKIENINWEKLMKFLFYYIKLIQDRDLCFSSIRHKLMIKDLYQNFKLFSFWEYAKGISSCSLSALISRSLQDKDLQKLIDTLIDIKADLKGFYSENELKNIMDLDGISLLFEKWIYHVHHKSLQTQILLDQYKTRANSNLWRCDVKSLQKYSKLDILKGIIKLAHHSDFEKNEQFQPLMKEALIMTQWPLLEFTYSGAELKDNLIEAIIHKMEQVKNMDFQIIVNIECKGFGNDIDEGTKNLVNCFQMHNLKQLSIDFFGTNFTDLGCSFLAELFRRSSSLTQIRIDMNWCSEVTNYGINEIMQGLAKLHLVQLDINLQCTSVSDEGVKSICESFHFLKEIKTLRLDFSCNKSFHFNSDISDEECSHLSNSISNLGYLSDLCLNYEKCDLIGDSTISGLLLENIYLVSLQLNFSNTEITDQGVIKLLQQLSKSHYLHHFTLYINETKVSDLSVTYLACLLYTSPSPRDS
eukprot:TRINITY_DN11865_c0_g1_i2.p1 TRINITY_DN11865_c0_g1~~TRINITY_DN11865_c0_g1_i2.p1  ORF type:complete len:512 (-),score=24.72 TRINITY_DN11865_c0_g1_i2:53-1588(-)